MNPSQPFRILSYQSLYTNHCVIITSQVAEEGENKPLYQNNTETFRKSTHTTN